MEKLELEKLLVKEGLVMIKKPKEPEFKAKIVQVNKAKTSVQVNGQGGRLQWILVDLITGPAKHYTETLAKTKDKAPAEPKERAREKVSSSDIQAQIDNYGKDELISDLSETKVKVALSKNVSHETNEVKEDKPTLGSKMKKLAEGVEDAVGKAQKKLATKLKSEEGNVKTKVLKMLKEEKPVLDIALICKVKVAYVNQIKADFFDEPKEGTTKANIVKLHAEGKEPQVIADELKTTLSHVKQQIRFYKQRQENKA